MFLTAIHDCQNKCFELTFRAIFILIKPLNIYSNEKIQQNRKNVNSSKIQIKYQKAAELTH